MINLFQDETPSELIKMVRGEAVCGECFGKSWNVHGKCPTCNGSGKQPPLSDTDLCVLAAIHCEGWEHWQNFEYEQWWSKGNSWHPSPPAYTSDPRHAMQLQEKYGIDTTLVPGNDIDSKAVWEALTWVGTKGIIERDTITCYHKNLRRAITEAAVIAALTEVLDHG